MNNRKKYPDTRKVRPAARPNKPSFLVNGKIERVADGIDWILFGVVAINPLAPNIFSISK